MPDIHSFFEEPDGTREAIMSATYHALCEYGYAGLTIQRIGEHFAKSKSLLYHHYDSKDDLLLDFLEFMLEEFEQTIPVDEQLAPDDQLDILLDKTLVDSLSEDQQDFTNAIVELRAQAAYDQRYRDHFTRSDQLFHDRITEIVQDGIEAGVFRDVDPDQIAAYLLTLITGAMTEQMTAETEFTTNVRAELDRYVESALLAGESDD